MQVEGSSPFAEETIEGEKGETAFASEEYGWESKYGSIEIAGSQCAVKGGSFTDGRVF